MLLASFYFALRTNLQLFFIRKSFCHKNPLVSLSFYALSMDIPTPDSFFKLLIQDLEFQPTTKQDIALQMLSKFVVEGGRDKLFLLKGFAGTGKTTIISTLTKNLWKIRKSGILLAPTGRAAKVISNYSKKEAFTIHKKIF